MAVLLALMSDSDATLLGVCLMLYGAFSFGFMVGRHPERQGEGLFEGVPMWVALGIIALILGLVIVGAVNSGGCEPGECDRPGP